MLNRIGNDKRLRSINYMKTIKKHCLINTSRRSLSLLVAGVLLSTAATDVSAQRNYQKYWEEFFSEREEPQIIEDNREPFKLEEEEYLYAPPFRNTIGVTIFEGESDTSNDPIAERALQSYTEGVYYLESGSPAKALKAFDDALKKDPENLFLKLQLADLCVMLNDLSRGESLLEEILKVDKQSYEAMLKMARIQLLRHRYGDARRWLEDVIEVKPNNIEALQTLTHLAYQVDRDLDKTIEYSQKILTIDDKNLTALLWNAEAQAEKGDIREASIVYQRLLKYRPTLIDRMQETARRLAAGGRIDDALVLYETGIKISPNSGELRSSWESILEERSGQEAVREAYERLIEEADGDLKIYEIYAEYLKRQGDWESLKTVREEMLDIDSSNLAALLDLARYYVNLNQVENAEPYFRLAIAANPTDAETNREVGKIYFDMGEADKAYPLLRRAVSLNEDDVQSVEALATIEESRGNDEVAEKLLKDALTANPANSFLLKRLGYFYTNKGDMESAADMFQQAIAADGKDFGSWLRLAKIYLESNDGELLDSLEDQAMKQFRENPNFAARYANLNQEYGEYERARRILEVAIDVVPDYLDARVLLAHSYIMLNEPELAVKSLDNIDKHIRGREKIEKRKSLALAQVFSQLGEYSKAEDAYRDIVSDYPEDISIWEPYLMSIASQNKEDQLKQEMNSLVRRFNTEEPVQTQLIRSTIYVQQGDADRAVSILKQLIRENADDPEVMFQLAMAASETNDLDTAEKYYKELMGLAPAEENGWYETAANNLGYLYAQNNIKLDEAEELIKSALSLNPNAAYILDSMGTVYTQMGQYEKAREYLEAAAKRSVRDPEVYLNLGQLYEKKGEKETARQYYDKALELNPDMKKAQEKRDALAIEDFDEAVPVN